MTADVNTVIKWLSRDVRNWFENDFDSTIDYQSDVERFCLRAVPDVSDVSDLTPLGAAVYYAIKGAENDRQV